MYSMTHVCIHTHVQIGIDLFTSSFSERFATGKSPRPKRLTCVFNGTHILTSISLHFQFLAPNCDYITPLHMLLENKSLRAFQNMYLEINKKTQQMSILYGILLIQ